VKLIVWYQIVKSMATVFVTYRYNVLNRNNTKAIDRHEEVVESPKTHFIVLCHAYA